MNFHNNVYFGWKQRKLDLPKAYKSVKFIEINGVASPALPIINEKVKKGTGS